MFWNVITRVELPRRKIVAFGDSTTATRKERGVKRVYSQRLKKLLNVRGVNVKVVNAGLGCSHTGRHIDNPDHGAAHALDRLEMVRAHKPWIVIIQFGINDAWVDGDEPELPSRIPLECYVDNLTRIIDTLLTDGVRIILMTPNRLGKLYPDWLQQRLQEYTDAVLAIAENSRIELVDVWKMFGDYASRSNNYVDDLLLDSMHPNDTGHCLIAEALMDKIAESGLDNRTL